MRPHFIVNHSGKTCIKLHKGLYGPEIISNARKENEGFVASVKTQGNYYLICVNAESDADYFDFINYLLYLKRR